MGEAAITATAMTPAHRLRSIFSGSVGNLVEWYDWYVYSAFSLYFAPRFFPRATPTAQLLDTAAIFAVGFLMRPLGGWLLGRYADRHGRKAALMLSVLMMCAGSLLIAVTPGYAAHRPGGAGAAGAGATAAGPQRRRRVRHVGDLPERDGRRASTAASGRASST